MSKGSKILGIFHLGVVFNLPPVSILNADSEAGEEVCISRITNYHDKAIDKILPKSLREHSSVAKATHSGDDKEDGLKVAFEICYNLMLKVIKIEPGGLLRLVNLLEAANNKPCTADKVRNEEEVDDDLESF